MDKMGELCQVIGISLDGMPGISLFKLQVIDKLLDTGGIRNKKR